MTCEILLMLRCHIVLLMCCLLFYSSRTCHEGDVDARCCSGGECTW